MRLYNTISRQLEVVTPRPSADGAGHEPVGLYVCGVTPYDTTHLGHAFTYVSFDVLVRYLRYRGLDVRYVQNVTDIDDDILRRAGEVGIAWNELAEEETAHFLDEMAVLNVAPPDVFTRATDNITEMQDLIERMIASGHAYVRSGNVYYRVATFPSYGQLSKLDLPEMLAIAAERGGHPTDPLKDNPLDFILWQAMSPGEPSWPSPWGPGRPGWHIECSAMAMRFLGPTVDIHGGGGDLIFPHHECEIAQSETATGARPFVRYWLHTGMLRYEGEKMSKSLGNLVQVHRLLSDGYHPDAIRLALLRHRYRDAWEYETREIDEAAALALVLARETATTLETAPGDADLRARFEMALDDDLDTPTAIATLAEAATSPTVGARTRKELANVLGLTLGAHLDRASWPKLTRQRVNRPRRRSVAPAQ